MTATINVLDNSAAVSNALDLFVASASAKAIETTGRFTIAISGGSLPAILARNLKDNKSVDFSKWHVFYADERCVPYDSPDSNHGLTKQVLLDYVPVPNDQIYPISQDFVSDPEKAALHYQSLILSVFGDVGVPRFDLILLGMGPDGHTCSLFPGHALLDENEKLIAWLSDSPKPPPSRITFTYRLVNNATTVAFVTTGDGKAQVLHEIIDKKNTEFPSTRVVPTSGQLVWFVDKGAASLLGSSV